MRPTECPRDADLLDALRTGAWPEQAPAGLREHVESCASCAALAGLITSLQEDHRALGADAGLPSSSFMWWRLQLRARREAADLAMRPIRAAHGLALAGALGLLGALAAAFAPTPTWLAGWLGSVGRSAAAAGTASLPAAGQWLSPAGFTVAMIGALVLVVAPVAIYLALSDR